MTEVEKLEVEKDLFIQDYPQETEFGIVFGSEVAQEMKARVFRAIDLFHSGHIKKVLFTGGNSIYPTPEAELMAELAVSNEIPSECILLEKKSKNTFENVLFSKILLEESGYFAHLQRITLVSSIWHMTRIRYWMLKSFSESIEYICCPETMTTPPNWHLDKTLQRKILDQRNLFNSLRDRK